MKHKQRYIVLHRVCDEAKQIEHEGRSVFNTTDEAYKAALAHDHPRTQGLFEIVPLEARK